MPKAVIAIELWIRFYDGAPSAYPCGGATAGKEEESTLCSREPLHLICMQAKAMLRCVYAAPQFFQHQSMHFS